MLLGYTITQLVCYTKDHFYHVFITCFFIFLFCKNVREITSTYLRFGWILNPASTQKQPKNQSNQQKILAKNPRTNKKHSEKFIHPEKNETIKLSVSDHFSAWLGNGESVHSHLIGNFLGEVFWNFFLKFKDSQKYAHKKTFSFHCIGDACKAYRHK